jgi:hypothetical protein
MRYVFRIDRRLILGLGLLAWIGMGLGVCLAGEAAAGKRPCRLAVVSEASLWRENALLTTLFAQVDGVTVVERAELERITKEQELAFGPGPGSLQACRLAGADGVVFLERLEHEGKPYVAFRLVRVNEGVILDGDVFPEQFSEVMALPEAICRACEPQLPKLTGPLAKTLPLGMVNIRATISTPEAQLLERQLTLALGQHLMLQPQVCLLERRRMGALQFEKTLKTAREHPYWASAYLVEGILSPRKDADGWQVEAQVLDARRKALTTSTLDCPAREVNRVAKELTDKLLASLSRSAAPVCWDAAAEAAYYRAEARWAVDHGLYAEGMSAAETALTLNPERDVEAAYLFIAAAGGQAFANTLDPSGYPSVHELGFSVPEVITEQDLENARLAIAACRRELDLGPKSMPVRWGINYHWAVQFRRAWAAGKAMSREAQRKKDLAPFAQTLQEECRQLAEIIRAQVYRENNETILGALGYRNEEERERKAKAEAAAATAATTVALGPILTEEKPMTARELRAAAQTRHAEEVAQLKRELLGKLQFPPLPRIDHVVPQIDLAKLIGRESVTLRYACQTGRGREIGLVLALSNSNPTVLRNAAGQRDNWLQPLMTYVVAWLDPDTGRAETWDIKDGPGYDNGHPYFAFSGEWVAIVDQKSQLWCGSRKGRTLRKMCTLPGVMYQMMGPIAIHGNHFYAAMGQRYYNHHGWNYYGAGFVGGRPDPLASAGVLRVELPDGHPEILASSRRRPGRNGLEDRNLYHVEGLVVEPSGKGLWLVTYNKPSCDLHYLDLETGASRLLHRSPPLVRQCLEGPGTAPLLHGNSCYDNPLIAALGRNSVDFLLARRAEVVEYQLPCPRWFYDEQNTTTEMTAPPNMAAYDGNNLFVYNSSRLEVYRPGHRSPTTFWLSQLEMRDHFGIFVDDRNLLIANPSDSAIWRYDRAAILAACDQMMDPPEMRMEVDPSRHGTTVVCTHLEAGVEIRYTLDGSLPETDSPRYEDPLPVSGMQMLVARAFDPQGKRTPSGPVYQVLEPLLYVPPVALDAPSVPGLQVERFDGAWSWLPDLDALTPVARQVVERPRFDLPGRPEAYALRFTGFLQVPREGKYTFRLRSDDGSRLLLGGEVVADNDGWHPPYTVDGFCHLSSGQVPFELQYMNYVGGETLELSWAGPDFDMQPIPKEAFGHLGDEEKKAP